MPDTNEATPHQATASVAAAPPPPQGPGVNIAPGAPAPAESPPLTDAQKFAAEYELDETQFVPAAPSPVAPPPPVAPPAAAAAPKPSARLLRLAASLGIDPTGFSVEDLEEEVYHRNVAAIAVARERNREAPAPPPEVEPEFDLGEYTDAEGKPHKVADDLHPALVKLFKDQHAAIRDVRKENAALRQERQADQVKTANRMADDAFAALQSDHVYGQGTIHTLKRDSQEAARRLAVLGEARRLAGPQAGLEQQLAMIPQAHANLYGFARQAPRQATPPAPELSSRAEQLANEQARARNPVNGQYVSPRITPEQWNGLALARPTEQTSVPETGDRAAIRRVGETMRAKGFETVDIMPDEVADLPD